MPTRLANETVKCSFHLTNRALWLLEALADRMSRNTGEVIRVTRTEVIEIAIRQLAKLEKIQ
jgi:hypothetical protein